jgi:hypothetical protein
MASALRCPTLPALLVLGCCGCSFAPWLNVPAAKVADNQYIVRNVVSAASSLM